jgi:hypothetical protein
MILKNYILFIFIILCSIESVSAQQASVLIDGNPSTLLPNLSFPYWLKAGQTIAPSAYVKRISGIEFSFDTSRHQLEMSSILNIENTATVPAGKVWKIEALSFDTLVKTAILNDQKAVYTAGGTSTTGSDANALKVGDLYQGGIVAYLFKPGEQGYVAGQQHGMIVAMGYLVEQSIYSTRSHCGAYGSGIGAGRANTDSILSHDSLGTAALLCRNFNGGGFNDWYLPSALELQVMINAQITVLIYSPPCWSSTEFSDTDVYVTSGSYVGTQPKTNPLYTLPVRLF